MGKKLHIPDPEDEEGEAELIEGEEVDWDFVLNFQSIVEELKSTDGIVDVEYAHYNPVSNITLETLEHGLGLTVPERIMQFYLRTNGLELHWRAEIDGEVVPGGGFQLLHFEAVFDNWLDELWPVGEELDEETEDFLWTLRGFDARPDADGRWMSVFCVEDEHPSFDLFLHDPNNYESHLLEVDFPAYLKFLFETRGAFGWVPLVSDIDPEEDEQLAAEMERFWRIMETYFPRADLDELPVDPAERPEAD